MNIKRIYNNNVVMVEKDNGEEMIVLGKGLAFGKKVGETIEEEQIEKIFTLAENCWKPSGKASIRNSGNLSDDRRRNRIHDTRKIGSDTRRQHLVR